MIRNNRIITLFDFHMPKIYVIHLKVVNNDVMVLDIVEQQLKILHDSVVCEIFHLDILIGHQTIGFRDWSFPIKQYNNFKKISQPVGELIYIL